MNTLFSSASKIVFILIAIGAITGFFLGILEAKDFMLLAVSAFSFYFTKTNPSSSDSSDNTKSLG